MATDPKLPAAFQREVAAAEAIQAQLEAAMSRAPVQAVTAPMPPAPPTPAPTADTPPSPPPPPPAPAPAPTAPSIQDVINSNAELAAEIRRAALAQQRPAAPQPPPDAGPQVINVAKAGPIDTPDEKEKFGDDVLGMVNAKIARFADDVRVAFNQLHNRLVAIENGAQRAAVVAEKSVQEVFFERLARAVPDYEAINKEPAWIQYLQAREPGSRKTRQENLNEAAEAYDAAIVAEVFNAYKSTKAPPPAPPQQQNQLESQIQPDTAASEAPQAPTAKPIFLESQVKSFYDDLRRGTYKGRESEAAAIAAVIDLAAAENRIRKG